MARESSVETNREVPLAEIGSVASKWGPSSETKSPFWRDDVFEAS